MPKMSASNNKKNEQKNCIYFSIFLRSKYILYVVILLLFTKKKLNSLQVIVCAILMNQINIRLYTKFVLLAIEECNGIKYSIIVSTIIIQYFECLFARNTLKL